MKRRYKLTDQEIMLNLRESIKKLTKSYEDICRYADQLEVKYMQLETKCKLQEDILKHNGLI